MPDDGGFLQLFDGSQPTKTLKAGDALFKKGDPADQMYVVKTGQFQIGDGNAVLETVGPGGMFGEMALIEREPRSATVKALTDGEVIAVDQKQFLRMVQVTPYFAIRVMVVLSARLRAMNKRVTVG